MRLVILKDTLISLKEVQQLQADFTDLYEKHTKITPEFYVEEHDFTNVPTFTDKDGDKTLPHSYLDKHCKDVYRRYSGEGADHVVFLVHDKNWRFRGIWGQNWSNIYYGYQVQLSRFDSKKPANSLGTLYHEVHHSHDAFIAVMLGIDVNKTMGIQSWDKEITHGQGSGWDYIRTTENTNSLRFIAKDLRDAYAARRKLYATKLTKYEALINHITRVIVAMRRQMNRKSKVV